MGDMIVRRLVQKAVKEIVEQRIGGVVDRIIRNHPRFQFVKAMQLEMLRRDQSIEPRQAWNVSVDALNAFLADEKIKFGHPDHDWSPDGALTLIVEYEIRHWESAP